jgi:ssDNA-binding Zn-finger/Zn-ribbon topoisomerase 1
MVKKLEGADLKQVEALLPLLKEESAKAQAMVAKIISANPAAAGNGAANLNNVPTDIDCDECGKPMVIRTGRRGQFLGCSGYPKCKNTSEVPAKLADELGLNGNGKAEPQPSPGENEAEEAA